MWLLSLQIILGLASLYCAGRALYLFADSIALVVRSRRDFTLDYITVAILSDMAVQRGDRGGLYLLGAALGGFLLTLTI